MKNTLRSFHAAAWILAAILSSCDHPEQAQKRNDRKALAKAQQSNDQGEALSKIDDDESLKDHSDKQGVINGSDDSTQEHTLDEQAAADDSQDHEEETTTPPSTPPLQENEDQTEANDCTNMLRLMTFNLRFDPLDKSSETDANGWLNKQNPRSTRVKDLISKWQPDIMGTQEGLNNQLQDLRAGWPYFDFFGAGRDNGKEAGEFTAIFYRKSRLQFLDGGHYWLSKTPDVAGSRYPGTSYSRMASWVRLKDTSDSKTYFVVNTHWDHKVPESREWAANLMVDRTRNDAKPGDRVIVLGDFNTDIDNAASKIITSGLSLDDAYRLAVPNISANELTVHGFKGTVQGGRIDFILTTPGAKTGQADIIRDSFGGKYPSDHYPVQVEMCW